MMFRASDFTLSNKIRFILSAWACLVLFAVLGGRTDVLQPTFAAHSNLQHTPRTLRTAEGSSISKGLLKDPVEYFESLAKTNGYCRKLVTFGGSSCKRLVDGDKLVCLDDHLAIPKKDCLVYSFGAGDDVSFEDAMINYAGCELHLFDPTVNASEFMDSDEKIKFHQIGLGDSEKVVSSKQSSKVFVLKPFDSILRQNGHVGRTIHYLKLDIESSEWEVLPYMLEKGLLDNVWQLAMEVHSNFLKNLPFDTWMKHLQRQHDILLSLEAIGFRKISYKET
ncbi:probable methyltransferase-like protein 24 [Penaeus chinensis]|uniref:probable methyltransferase-like protein 24 n=1 Tax=Penaeus chinensis TaxID=139456 RepID=UPI001FB7FC5B|nr:probable methyltransferase-like protein 24 [Penaeus chinensis]